MVTLLSYVQHPCILLKDSFFASVTTKTTFAPLDHTSVFQSTSPIWIVISLSCLPVNTVGFKTNSNIFF